MTVACVIPARAGSKRIHDKNLQLIGGVSLLERAIATALEAFGDTVVSTDSERYADIARAAGARVPDLRPPELASDTASTTDVVRHALINWAPGASIVVVVQPTSPFTTSDDLVRVVGAISEGGAATAITVTAVGAEHAFLLAVDGRQARFLLPELRGRRTQDVPLLAIPTGGAYAAPAGRVRDGGELVVEPIAPVFVPAERAIDIDDETDLDRARQRGG